MPHRHPNHTNDKLSWKGSMLSKLIASGCSCVGAIEDADFGGAGGTPFLSLTSTIFGDEILVELRDFLDMMMIMSVNPKMLS